MSGCGSDENASAVKTRGRRAAVAARIARLAAVAALVAVLSGCGLAGRVYIAFFWAAADYPDATFVCTAPKVPVLMTSMVKGRYYETLAGSYLL